MHAIRARLRLLRRGAAEARMDEEIALHIDLQAEQYLREGLSAEEARRRAVLDFGGVEGHREEIRGGRTLAWLGSFSLDLKLAWRMLVKHRGLTLVGGLGMAVAVAVATFFSDFTGAFFDATLPFEEGDRIVAIESWDTEANAAERRILSDFGIWREELQSVEGLGAWSPAVRNLVVPGGTSSPVTVARISASGFGWGVLPLMGRALVEGDESADAPAVAVIGHEVWRSRFGSDPEVVGREVRLGGEVHTVVGVMPDGFGFPVNHGFWVPLRVDPTRLERREGPGVYVFGRLAPGATLERAQAELATLGRRMASSFPATHERMRPRVVPYTLQFMTDITGWELALAQLLIVLLLAVICVNVSVLVYARTVTRVGEITVRSALGASRRRIVAQLFAEALVLSVAAAAVGVALAQLALEWWETSVERADDLSFWVDFGLSPETILYVSGLAVLGAAIVGVVPALKATGPRLRSGLGELGGGTGMRLGPTWTGLIVAQVAVAAAVLPAAGYAAWTHFSHGFPTPRFAAEEYLTARLAMDAALDEGGSAARLGDRLVALMARLEAEPGVAGVTFAARPVGATLPATIEVEELPAAEDAPASRSIRANHLDVGFFDTFGVPVLAGRGFRHADRGAAPTAVVVNRAFVDAVLGGRNAVGRQIRYTWRHPAEWRAAGADSLRWYEIVGVVGDQLAVGVDPGETEARVYHPAAPEQFHTVSLAARLASGAPADFAPRLRQVAAAVDPALQLHDVVALDASLREKQGLPRAMGLAIALVTLSVVLLSAAAIHALLSFTVARRRREIGIRAALGAGPRRLLASIFSRVLAQLALGLGLGTGAALLLSGLMENLTGGKETVVLPVAAGAMVVVALLAALGPARRGLHIHPADALRAD